MENTIQVSSVEKLCQIVSGLQREGLAFNVQERGNDWVINVTGY